MSTTMVNGSSSRVAVRRNEAFTVQGFLKEAPRTEEAVRHLFRTERKELANTLGIPMNGWAKRSDKSQVGALLKALQAYDARMKLGLPPEIAQEPAAAPAEAPKKPKVAAILKTGEAPPKSFRATLDAFGSAPVAVVNHVAAPSSWGSIGEVAAYLANHPKLKAVGFRVRIEHTEDDVLLFLYIPRDAAFALPQNWPDLLRKMQQRYEFAKGIIEAKLGTSVD